jgi:hypothetical protein
MDNYKLNLWKRFCEKHKIADTGVPLFSISNNSVNIVEIDIDRRVKLAAIHKVKKRQILLLSPQMEKLVISEVKKVLDDFSTGSEQYEGLIYMMYRLQNGQIVPLYIGKSEKYGKKGGNLSVNIKRIERNKGKFCRWGYQHNYHIGDLSAIVCNGHPVEKQMLKYRKWAGRLFNNFPTDTPCLKFPVYFWTTAWEKGGIGIWEDFGSTNLTFLEYLLIGVASDLFPNDLLNDEGVNRS